jgi:short-subunit dehydrogenase
LKKEIEETHRVQCQVLVQDITTPDWEAVSKALEGRTVSVLFNNVGGLGDLLLFIIIFFSFFCSSF